LTSLPASFDGPVPEFPLPQPVFGNEAKQVHLAELYERELAVWESTWALPQANAWSLPSEAWRVRSVAMWVRLAVRCEDPDASASLLGQLHRFADQVGLTTAGLAEMGWRVATDEVAARAVERSEPVVRRERRLRVAGESQ
jgi:hypothetical protein